MILGQAGTVVILREATEHDGPFLREMLAEAADWRPDAAVRSGDAVVGDPAVSQYVVGWPRPTDFGVVAYDDTAPVGAAWCRFFGVELHGYGFVSPDVPELTIGVVAGRRGEGIGRLLLRGLVDEAQRRQVETISLSVESDNPAIDLYADVGFVEVSRVDDSPTMVLDCRAT